MTNLARGWHVVFVFLDRHAKWGWIIAALMFAANSWRYFYEVPWLSYQNTPFQVSGKNFVPGEIVPLRVVRCNNTTQTQVYEVIRTLQPISPLGRPYAMARTIIDLTPGCKDSQSLANQLPPDVIPGKYRILGVSEVDGVFRRYRVSWESQPFDVVSPQ